MISSSELFLPDAFWPFEYEAIGKGKRGGDWMRRGTHGETIIFSLMHLFKENMILGVVPNMIAPIFCGHGLVLTL